MCPQFIWYWPYHACKYRAISVRICRIWEQMWVKHDWKAFILEESAVFSQILKLLRSLHFEGCVVRKRFHFLSSTLFLSAAVLLLVVEEVVLVKQQGGSALCDGGDSASICRGAHPHTPPSTRTWAVCALRRPRTRTCSRCVYLWGAENEERTDDLKAEAEPAWMPVEWRESLYGLELIAARGNLGRVWEVRRRRRRCWRWR